MSRIFLSHSSADNFQAKAHFDWLAEAGWDDVFLDLAPEVGIAPGERWERALHEAASRCEAVIFLISKNWLGSEWCDREFDLAVRLNKRLFGVLVDETTISDVPPKYRANWQLCDLIRGVDHKVFRVTLPNGDEQHVTFSQSGLASLKAGLTKAGLDARFFPWPPANDPDRAPYRGLAPLEAGDAGIFFGREAPTVEAMDMLRGLRDAAPPKLVAILGASGSGKSSFLRAGVLPRLARDDLSFLTLPIIRPERAALWGETGLLMALDKALALNGVDASRSELRKAITEGGELLLRWFRRLAPEPGAATLVISIDQSEELFDPDGAAEGSWLLALLRFLCETPNLPIIALFTIRSDSYDRLQTAVELDGVRLRPFNLSPMPRGAFKTIIEGPAARYQSAGHRLAIDPALVETLLGELEQGGSKDALPLLSFTLERLFVEHGGDGDLKLKEYHEFGGIAGAIDNAVEQALKAADSDPAVPRDRDARLALMRRGLIPWLAGIDPATNAPRRKIARWNDIPLEARPMMEHLVKMRLLARDASAEGETIVEPAHEALLRQWGALRGWLEEDLAVLSTLDGVKDAARDWAANARDPAFLVHSLGRLAAAEGLSQRPDLAANLSPQEHDYLAASRAAENERREKELSYARKLFRRTLTGLAVVTAMLVIAVGLAIVAFFQADEANRQRLASTVNEARSFIALSQLAANELRPVDVAELSLAGWPRQPHSPIPRFEGAFANLAIATQAAMPFDIFLHDLSVVGTLLSADESKVLTWSNDGTLRVWDVATGRPLTPPMQHEKQVVGAALSRDGTRILSWSEDNTLRVWDFATGTPVGEPMVHGDRIMAASFDRDDHRVLSASWDRSLRLWEATSGKQLKTLGEGSPYMGAVYLDDFTHILAWTMNMDNQNGVVRLLDAETGDPIGPPMETDIGLDLRVTFSPDNARIVTSTNWMDKADLWDLGSGKRLGELTHDDLVLGVTFSPDGKYVATWSSDKSARMWDAFNGRRVGASMMHDDVLRGALFDGDTRRLVTWARDSTVKFWIVPSGDELGALRHRGTVIGAVFNKDESRLLTWAADRGVRQWDARTGAQIGPLMLHDDAVLGARYTADESKIVSWSADHTARVWDTPQRYEFGQVMLHDDEVMGATYDLTGARILSWSKDGTVRLWNGLDGTPLIEPIRYSKPVSGALFASDQQRILSWSEDGTVQLSDAGNGAAVWPPVQLDSAVRGAVFSPDGRRILAWTEAGALIQADSASGAPFGSTMMHGGPVRGALYSADGGLILSWSDDSTARLWRADGSPIATMRHAKPLNGALFGADGRRILTWSDDGTARLWNAATGAADCPILEHRLEVASAAFDPSGAQILTASNDGITRLWDATTGQRVGPDMQNEGALRSADYLPGGGRIISTSLNEVRLFDAATGDELGPPMIPVGSEITWGVVANADGTRLLLWDGNDTLTLRDTATTMLLGPSLPHEEKIEGVMFAPDESHVLSWSRDHTVRQWVFPFPPGSILSVVCQRLGNINLSVVEQRYGIRIAEPICTPEQLAVPVDWKVIERLPKLGGDEAEGGIRMPR